MSWGVINWNSGDMIDVTRMNQYVANTEYITSLFSRLVIRNEPYKTDATAPNSNYFYIKIDGSQSGATLVNTDLSTNSASACSIYNMDIRNLSLSSHTIVPWQGSNLSGFNFVRTEEMNYLSYWVTLYKNGSTFGRYNFSVVTSNELIPT